MKKTFGFLVSFIFCCFLFFSCSTSEKNVAFEQLVAKQTQFDYLIQNASIIDGSGVAPFKGDVLIVADSIAFIGRVDTTRIQIANILEASGKVLSPGFIDTHAHGNPLATPGFSNFVSMGVTTICLGQDGFSPEVPELKAWIAEVEAKGIRPNVIMFTGHSTLRLLSGVGYESTPDSAGINKMGEILEAQLAAGSFGITTGLEYTPGMYAKQGELAYLAEITGQNGGIMMSHMRNEDNDAMEASLNELLSLGQYCPVHASHLKVVYGKGEERANEIQKLFEVARQKGIRATADIYPYTASFTGIGIVFPKWAKAPNNYEQVKATRREESLDFIREKVNKRNGPDATLFGTAPYTGKTLAQVAKEKGKSFEEVLVDDIGPTGASAAYFVMDETLQNYLLKDSLTMLCSDGSPTMNHPRGYGSFSKMISQFVVSDSLFTLQEAIRKMTYLPAQTLGLQDRGLLKSGYKADLLLFDPEEVTTKATFENPFQEAEGFNQIWINGKAVKEKGVFNDENPGKVLKKQP